MRSCTGGGSGKSPIPLTIPAATDVDANIGELTHAGVDSIHRGFSGRDTLDDRPGSGHALDGFG